MDIDLFNFLIQVVGFDTVDDESCPENFFVEDLKLNPEDFTKKENPHYAYWIYYLHANIVSLNHLRKSRGLNTFTFRPHSGEAGSINHLAAAFLTSDGINHGIQLDNSPILTYLFYLTQIGISLAPLSNNK